MKIYFNTQTFSHKYSLIEVIENPAEAELVVLGAKKIKPEDFKNLKAVYRFGVGTDNIPFEYLKAKSIPVYLPSEKTKEVLFNSTAGFAVFLILQMYFSPTLGDIDKWKKFTRDSLANKKLLVMGMGNIGRLVAQKMQALLQVLTYDVATNSEQELKALLQQADILSLHFPLTEQTKGFFDQEKLSWLKDDVILVNTARGALVGEEALYQRLMNSKMRAAFDVFWEEPYQGKLKELGSEKFFMTPHIASQTSDFVESGFQDILDIIKKHEGAL